jgi:hypothetical protein
VSETCSARLEVEDSEPVIALKSDMCSVTLEAAVNVPISVLKVEECSTRTEDKASEAERFLGKLLTSEPAMDKELAKVLNMEA